MKRIIGILMIIGILINGSVFAVENNGESMVTCKETEILAGLQIYPMMHDNDEKLTRGEFANILAKIDGVTFPDEFTKGAFFDVKQGDSDAAVIDYVYLNGYMTVTDNKFGKDENLTAEDAIFGILNVMGYKSESFAGIYKELADSLNITKGMNITKGEIDYYSLSKLIYNSLSASMYHGSDLLTVKLKLTRRTGIVEGVYGKYLYGTPIFLKENELFISGQKYIAGDSEILEAIGYNVDFWYHEDEDSEPQIFYWRADSKYSSMTISIKDVTETAEDKISYNDGSKVKNIRLADDIRILRNSIPQVDLSFAEDSAVKGDITFIMKDNKALYAFARTYKSYAVEKVKDNVITFKYGESGSKSNTLKLNDENMNYIVITDGIAGSVEDITAGSIISVAHEENSEYCFIYVSAKYVEGTVTSYRGDDGTNIYTMDNNEYTMDSRLYEKTEKRVKGTQKISLNEDYGFYLDVSGEIVDVELLGYNKFLYGYITKVSIDEMTLPEIYQMKIYCASPKGEKKYDIPKNIKFNGKQRKREDIMRTVEEYWKNSTELNPPICKYKISRKGDIEAITIDVRKTFDNVSDDYITMPYEPGEYLYYNYYNYFTPTASDKKANVIHRKDWDNLVCFRIPGNRQDTKKFDAGSPADMGIEGDGKIKANFAFYDFDEFCRPACMVYNASGAQSISNETEDVIGVQRLSTVLNEDNDVVYRIGGYMHGVYCEYNIEDEELIELAKTLKKGDFIIITTDGGDTITDAELYMTVNEDKYKDLIAKYDSQKSDDWSIGKWMLIAKVAASAPNYIKLNGDPLTQMCIISPESNYRRFLHDGGFTIYDCEKGEYVYGAFWDDLDEGDLICGVTKADLMYNFVAIKNPQFANFEDYIPDHMK